MLRLPLLACCLVLPLSVRAQQQPATETCVDVTVGSERSYACLNAALARTVAAAHAPLANATVDAASPAPRTGLFNETATRERMGANYGRSAIPARDPKPNTVNPLFPPAH